MKLVCNTQLRKGVGTTETNMPIDTKEINRDKVGKGTQEPLANPKNIK